jgi:LPS-assembly protein
VGQIRYLTLPEVTLPGETPQTTHASDIISEVSLTAYKHWRVNLDYQVNPYTSQTDKSEVLIQYRPDPSEVVNLGYRFQRNISEVVNLGYPYQQNIYPYQQNILKQYDGSFAWPIASHWNTVGRWVYSTDNHRTIEQLAGIEYKSCCWRIQILQRRYVTNRNGGLDTSIALQLELTGLSSVGKPANAFLSKEISGYSTRDPNAE